MRIVFMTTDYVCVSVSLIFLIHHHACEQGGKGQVGL